MFHAITELGAAVQPAVAGVEVGFVDGPIGMRGDFIGGELDGAPGVGNVAVEVVDDFIAGFGGAAE